MIERAILALGLVAALCLCGFALRLYFAERRRRVMAAAGAAPGSVSPGQRPTLLYLYAEQCGQCPAQSRAVGEIESRLGNLIQVLRVDALDQPDLAARYGIWTVPATVVLDSQGSPRAVNCGLTSEKQLESQVLGAIAA